MAWTYNEETQVYTVEVGELESLLTSLPTNSVDSPYKMEITQLTESDVYNSSTKYEPGYGGKLGWSISKCKKYVDLSPTVFTQNIRYSKCFLYCDYLVVAPTFYWEAEEPFFVLSGTFYGCKNLKTLPNLPDINTTLDRTFYNCSSLESIPTLPSRCNSIEMCFRGCSSLISVPNLPEYGYPSIAGLFRGCTNLKNVPEIKSNQITDAAECFEGCVSIENFPDLPDSIQNMNWCFLDCTQIVTPPKMPANTTTMEQCFRGCTSLVETPHIPESVKTMERCFYDCTSLIEVKNIPSKIEKMSEAFYNSGIIKTPLLPEKVEYSDAYGSYSGLYRTFKDCKNLVEITNIPSETEVFDETFVNCISLKEVPELSNKIKSISFKGCTSLKTITNIPASIIIVLLDQCTSLETVKMWDFSDTGVTSEVYLGDCTSLKYIGVENCGKDVLLDNYLEDNRTRFRIPDSVDIKLLITPIDNRIPFPQLEEYLAYKSENTKDTPYKLNITELTEENIGASSSENTLGFVFRQNNTKYVDLEETVLPSVKHMSNCFGSCSGLVTAPVIPDSVTNMRSCFYSCTSLTTSPVIPDSITDMHSCFENCTSLTIAPNIPDSVTNMNSCFRNCTSLKEINSWNNMSNIYDIYNAFYQCPSLEYIGTDNLYTEQQLENYLESNKTGAGITFNIKEVVKPINNTVEYTDLDNYLRLVPQNDDETPYDVNILNIPAIAVTGGELKTIIFDNDKYLNLGATVLPDVTDMSYAFDNAYPICEFPKIPDTVTNLTGCFAGTMLDTLPELPSDIQILDYAFAETFIKEIPSLPNTVTSMKGTFKNCFELTSAVLPSGVTNVSECFSGCKKLTQPPLIPNTVSDAAYMFKGCKALTKEAEIPPSVASYEGIYQDCSAIETINNVPAGKASYKNLFNGCSALTTIYGFELSYEDLNNGVYDTTDMFKGCTSLADIFIDKPTLTESDSWKLVRIDAESDTASVYSSEGVLEYTVPVSVDKYKKYELEGYIDEIVVAESGQITDEIIEKFFKYQKPFTNDPSKSLNPANSNFVLWAKDPDSVVSNILNGGGSSFKTMFDLVRPIGDTYVQYPQQASPMDLWGAFSTWEVINYDGAFFRAEGTNAEAFIEKTGNLVKQTESIKFHQHDFGWSGTTQSMNRNFAHNHPMYTFLTSGAGTIPLGENYGLSPNKNKGDWIVYQQDGNQTEPATGTLAADTNHEHYYSGSGTTEGSGGTENRPSNYTFRIWKRTA